MRLANKFFILIFALLVIYAVGAYYFGVFPRLLSMQRYSYDYPIQKFECLDTGDNKFDCTIQIYDDVMNCYSYQGTLVFDFPVRYGIPADLREAIYDQKITNIYAKPPIDADITYSYARVAIEDYFTVNFPIDCAVLGLSDSGDFKTIINFDVYVEGEEPPAPSPDPSMPPPAPEPQPLDWYAIMAFIAIILIIILMLVLWFRFT